MHGRAAPTSAVGPFAWPPLGSTAVADEDGPLPQSVLAHCRDAITLGEEGLVHGLVGVRPELNELGQSAMHAPRLLGAPAPLDNIVGPTRHGCQQ